MERHPTADERQNTAGTGAPIDTGLTQPRSGFDLEEVASQLTRIRNRVGALTPAGHRCSNLLEMFDELPPGPEDRIEYLTSDAEKARYDTLIRSIRKQTADLARLTQTAVA